MSDASLRAIALGWACSQYAKSLLAARTRTERWLVLYYLLTTYVGMRMARSHTAGRVGWIGMIYAGVICACDEIVQGWLRESIPARPIYLVRGKSGAKGECCVCLDSCGELESFCVNGIHVMHPECATHWYCSGAKSVCPMCRQPMLVKECTIAYEYYKGRMGIEIDWKRIGWNSMITITCIAGVVVGWRMRNLQH